jgi:hypothetical protein
MNDAIAWIFAIWLAVTTAVTINVILIDYRNFDQLVKACQTTGHFQDTKTRIICAPEKPVDRN